MQPVYKKQDDHFFKQISENKVIHVVFVERDHKVVTRQGSMILETEFKKNDALINMLDRFPYPDLLPSTEAEFTEAMQKAYFELGLYQYSPHLST